MSAGSQPSRPDTDWRSPPDERAAYRRGPIQQDSRSGSAHGGLLRCDPAGYDPASAVLVSVWNRSIPSGIRQPNTSGATAGHQRLPFLDPEAASRKNCIPVSFSACFRYAREHHSRLTPSSPAISVTRFPST